MGVGEGRAGDRVVCDLHDEATRAALVDSPGLLDRGGVRGRRTVECASCPLCRAALTWLALAFPEGAEVQVPRGFDREAVWRTVVETAQPRVPALVAAPESPRAVPEGATRGGSPPVARP